MTVTLMKGEAQICLVEKEGDSHLCVCANASLMDSVSQSCDRARRVRPQVREVEGTATGHAGRLRQSQAWIRGPLPCAMLLPAIGQRRELKIAQSCSQYLKLKYSCTLHKVFPKLLPGGF